MQYQIKVPFPSKLGARLEDRALASNSAKPVHMCRMIGMVGEITWWWWRWRWWWMTWGRGRSCRGIVCAIWTWAGWVLTCRPGWKQFTQNLVDTTWEQDLKWWLGKIRWWWRWGRACCQESSGRQRWLDQDSVEPIQLLQIRQNSKKKLILVVACKISEHTNTVQSGGDQYFMEQVQLLQHSMEQVVWQKRMCVKIAKYTWLGWDRFSPELCWFVLCCVQLC